MSILRLILLIALIAVTTHAQYNCDKIWHKCQLVCEESPGDCHRCLPLRNEWKQCCHRYNICDNQNRLILGPYHIETAKEYSYRLNDTKLIITNLDDHTFEVIQIECPSNFIKCYTMTLAESMTCNCLQSTNESEIQKDYNTQRSDKVLAEFIYLAFIMICMCLGYAACCG